MLIVYEDSKEKRLKVDNNYEEQQNSIDDRGDNVAYGIVLLWYVSTCSCFRTGDDCGCTDHGADNNCCRNNNDYDNNYG